MVPEYITLCLGESRTEACSSVILVPDQAVSEAGRIQMVSSNTTGQSKHEFYTLAQIALIQFEDGEMEVQSVEAPIKAVFADQTAEFSEGLAICRLDSGSLALFACTQRPHRKLLEAAHRYCTRWIRLDL